MALWSVSSLESCGEDKGEDSEPVLAEDAKKLDPIIKFSNLMSDANVTSHCERVRSLAYNKHNYVCLLIHTHAPVHTHHTHTLPYD